MRIPSLPHLATDQSPEMVDVSGKSRTIRCASALAEVCFPGDAAAVLGLASAAEVSHIRGPKGPIFETAKLAGVVEITSSCRTSYRTGVEMEALAAVSVAALTVYDMCKALSHAIEIRNVVLLAKSGEKADHARP